MAVLVAKQEACPDIPRSVCRHYSLRLIRPFSPRHYLDQFTRWLAEEEAPQWLSVERACEQACCRHAWHWSYCFCRSMRQNNISSHLARYNVSYRSEMRSTPTRSVCGLFEKRKARLDRAWIFTQSFGNGNEYDESCNAIHSVSTSANLIRLFRTLNEWTVQG